MTMMEKLQAKKAQIDQKAADDIAAIESKKAADQAEVDADLAQLKIDLDKAFDEGVAQSGSPGDKLYSEEELQAELLPLKNEIAAYKVEVQGLKDQVQQLIDSQAASMAAFKADIAAKLENAAIDNAAVVAELKA